MTGCCFQGGGHSVSWGPDASVPVTDEPGSPIAPREQQPAAAGSDPAGEGPSLSEGAGQEQKEEEEEGGGGVASFLSAGGEQAPEDLAEQLLQGLEPHGLSMARVSEVLVANLQVGRKACVADGWTGCRAPTYSCRARAHRVRRAACRPLWQSRRLVS